MKVRPVILAGCFLLTIVAQTMVAQPLTNPTQTADKILVLKSARTLKLLRGEKVIKTYKIALGGHPIGSKQQEGDHKTPEGTYVIDFKKPNSHFHRALHISYPSAADRKRAAQMKVSPGADIMIHGLAPAFAWVGSKHLLMDWTDGCIAVTNEEIEEIWNLVPEMTPIEIRP